MFNIQKHALASYENTWKFTQIYVTCDWHCSFSFQMFIYLFWLVLRRQPNSTQILFKLWIMIGIMCLCSIFLNLNEIHISMWKRVLFYKTFHISSLFNLLFFRVFSWIFSMRENLYMWDKYTDKQLVAYIHETLLWIV